MHDHIKYSTAHNKVEQMPPYLAFMVEQWGGYVTEDMLINDIFIKYLSFDAFPRVLFNGALSIKSKFWLKQLYILDKLCGKQVYGETNGVRIASTGMCKMDRQTRGEWLIHGVPNNARITSNKAWNSSVAHILVE